MSQNVDLVRLAFEAFRHGDFTLYDTLPDDFELALAAEMPDAGTYRGESARRWLRAWVESFERLQLEPREFIDAGDRVVVGFIQRGWIGGSQAPVELPTWSITTIRDGVADEPARVVSRVQLFMDRDEALAVAGVPG